MIVLKGKEGLPHVVGKNIQNVFQNLFKQRGKWRRFIKEVEPHYSPDAPRACNKEKWVVFMADGLMHHGGLADRLRGIIAAYSMCKEMGLTFKVYFKHPFDLEKYLQPNLVDWRIAEEELSRNSLDSIPMFCGSNDTVVEPPFQRLWFKKQYKRDAKQIHVYSNAFLERGDNFGKLFAELFKPTPLLESALVSATEAIGSNYVSFSARFLSLLADFNEVGHKALDHGLQEQLKERCVEEIEKAVVKYKISGKVLLTSDSMSFLKYATERLPYVVVMEGSINHVDYNYINGGDSDLKLFVDFFMLSRAEHLYLLQVPNLMYNSGFPRRAAQVGGKRLTHIKFNV